MEAHLAAMVAVRAALVAVAPGVPDGDPVVERDRELVGEVPAGTTAAVGLDVGLIPVAGAGPDDPVVRVVMMGIVRVGRSVMMTGRRGKNESPAPKLNVAAGK